MLKANNITKNYGRLEVLKEVSIEVQEKEIISIVGASGVGKSTLLQILGTLDQANKGEVYINNIDITKLKQNELAKFRNQKIGFIFQFHNLLPEFTALENVCLPGLIAGYTKKNVEKKASELLNLLNVKGQSHHKPNELSGGEQQRIAVARALINNPAIIFADEPSGNLDSKNAKELHELFFELRKQFGQTFIIVTHNKELASMADRTLEMENGRILNCS